MTATSLSVEWKNEAESWLFPAASMQNIPDIPTGIHRHTYKERHLVEKLFLKLKNNRRFATRYEKKALIFMLLSASLVSSFGYSDGFKTRSRGCLQIKDRRTRGTAVK